MDTAYHYLETSKIGRCGSSMLRSFPNYGTIWLHNADDDQNDDRDDDDTKDR